MRISPSQVGREGGRENLMHGHTSPLKVGGLSWSSTGATGSISESRSDCLRIGVRRISATNAAREALDFYGRFALILGFDAHFP